MVTRVEGEQKEIVPRNGQLVQHASLGFWWIIDFKEHENLNLLLTMLTFLNAFVWF